MEACSTLEELALNALETRTGMNNTLLKKMPTTKGIYAISTLNKISLYKKVSDGWFFSGKEELLIEFELIVKRKNREIIREIYNCDMNFIKDDFYESLLLISQKKVLDVDKKIE